MSISSRALAVLLAVSIARTASAAPDERDRERVADDAAAHLDRGEFREAATDFATYYRLLGDNRATVVGENSVLIAVDAYWRAWDASRDRADLEAARALLVEHLDAVEARTGARTGKAADRAAIELLAVEKTLLETAPAEPTPPVEPEPEPEPEPAPAAVVDEPAPRVEPPAPGPSVPTEPARDRASSGRDRLGIGLVAGGSIGLAGGIALLAIGGTLVPRARTQFDACEDCDVSQRDDYLDRVRTASRPYLIAGGVAAGVGLGLLAWGIVRLVQHSRRGKASARRWMPIPGGLAMIPADPEGKPDRDPSAR